MDNLRLAAVVGLAVLATVSAVEWLKTGLQLKQGGQPDLQVHQNSGVAANQNRGKAPEEAGQAQQVPDLAAKQRSAMEVQLRKVQEEKAQLTKQNAYAAAFYPTAPETRSQKEREGAQEYADFMANSATKSISE
jgi:hypothetical protein